MNGETNTGGTYRTRFRSRSEHTLDAKGRLNIPSRFREVLRGGFTEELVVVAWDKCLRAYPPVTWEALEDKLLNSAAESGLGGLVRYVISSVTECPLDKQGRILLPNSLRSEFGIDKDVVLNGMLKHFEIWEKNAWAAETRGAKDNFKDFEPGLARIGIL